MKKLRQFILAAVIIGSVLTPSATAAESASVLLQKGIYAEETEGNLDSAIKIYQQITAEAATNRSVVAQAQYRLGVCYQKKGNKEQAISVLNELLKEFPAEATLGLKARELLAGLGQAPAKQITLRQIPLNLFSVVAVSPDGRLIAYRAKDGGPVLIYEISTGKKWTAIEQYTDQVIFSSDGRSLAYRRSGGIYTSKVDGTEVKQVSSSADKNAITWVHEWNSENGQLLVSSWRSQKRGYLGTLDLANGQIREIINWPTGSSDQHWIEAAKTSPDRRFLAYWRLGVAQRGIFILDQVSNTETKISDKDIGQLVGWQPESSNLLFTSNRTGTTGLWAIAVRPSQPMGEPELIKANIFTRSGRSAVGLTRDGSLFYTERNSPKDIYLAKADFKTGEILEQPRRVNNRFQGEQSMPVWSKDGQKLMYVGDQRYLIAVPLGAGEPMEFPVWGTFGSISSQWSYAWSHDRTYLLVNSSRTGVGLGIHRYELASGASETLVKTMNDRVPGHWNCHPRIAPDGESFYYARRDWYLNPATQEEEENGKDSIIRRHLQSGQEETVYRSPQQLAIMWPFEVSPDGEHLALKTVEILSDKKKGGALKVHSLRSGETRELVPAVPGQWFNSLAWTADSKRLLFPKRNTDQGGKVVPGSSIIRSIAVEGGQSVEITFQQPNIFHIALHPDGRQIAFKAGPAFETKLWVLEGLMAKPVAATAGTTNK